MPRKPDLEWGRKKPRSIYLTQHHLDIAQSHLAPGETLSQLVCRLLERIGKKT
jgi:hypothetical protein